MFEELLVHCAVKIYFNVFWTRRKHIAFLKLSAVHISKATTFLVTFGYHRNNFTEATFFGLS